MKINLKISEINLISNSEMMNFEKVKTEITADKF